MRGRIKRLNRDSTVHTKKNPTTVILSRVQKDYQMWCINAGVSVTKATLLGIGRS